jgi:hypothetical protein
MGQSGEVSVVVYYGDSNLRVPESVNIEGMIIAILGASSNWKIHHTSVADQL